MLSGHHHLFQVLEYQASLPVQIVSGHGGDFLNAGSSENPAGWVLGGVVVKRGLNITGAFGFSMLERQGDGWRLTNYDRAGLAQKSCLIRERTADCR